MFTQRELTIIELGLRNRIKFLSDNPQIPDSKAKQEEALALVDKVIEAQQNKNKEN